MLPAFLTTILFSLSAVCAQRTTKALGGVEANFWRILLATIVLGVWAHTVGKGISGPAFHLFLLSGVLGFGLGDIALYQALPRLGSRLSILLVHCLAAPFAATTEWFWLGTRMSGREIIGAVLILSGVALALAPGKHLDIPRRTFWIGVICGVVAALGQGMGAVLSGYASRQDANAGLPVDGLTAAYQRILSGLAVALVFWLMVCGKKRARRSADAEAAELGSETNEGPWPLAHGSGWLPSRSVRPWIIANALAGPAFGVGCYQWALMTEKSGVVLPIVALTPLVIIPFSRFVEGERPHRRSLAGGVIAVAGVFILAGGVDFLRRWFAA
jgi:drug/metabolite transporter (DMT)-like permease